MSTSALHSAFKLAQRRHTWEFAKKPTRRAVWPGLVVALILVSGGCTEEDTHTNWMKTADDFSGTVVRGATNVNTSLDEFNGGPTAHIDGAFSDVADWPLGAIHAVLTPLGTVLTYGTAPDAQGIQENSSGLIYDVWNPLLGLSAASHTTLNIVTPTNIFCSAHVVLPGSGNILITGGDQHYLPGGITNDGINHVNLYNPLTNAMTLMSESMAYPRWYPTVTTLPNGEQLVQGGLTQNGLPSEETGAMVPEIYNPDTGWRTLDGATSQELWGYGWYYPRAFVTPTTGKVLSFKDYRKEIFLIDPSGDGSTEQIARHDIILSAQDMSAVMYLPGKIMTIYNKNAFLVDVSESDTPVISQTQSLIDLRHDADATLLFDGTVLLSGGSGFPREEEGALAASVYPVDIWSPETGIWQRGASAQMERLYHSSALLLPNGAVLTAGGGPPGPVANINAEIYYPPYLFKKDGSGELAPRPRISSMGQIAYGYQFQVEFSDATTINSVAVIRTGAVTHSFDQAQRYVPLEFEQQGNQLTVTAPANGNIAPPGQYMLVVTDDQGVPSEGRIFQIVNDDGMKILSPAIDATLGTDTLSISWTAMDGATAYEVLIGSAPGNRDYGARVTTGTQYRMQNLPTDGRQLFVTLRYRGADDQWQTGDSVSVTAVNWPSLEINSHLPGGQLNSDTAVFTWPANPDAVYYQIRIGSTENASDLGAHIITDTQFSISDLPTDGRDVYVTILYNGSDGRWRQGGSIRLSAVDWPLARFSSHQEGDALSSDTATFQWQTDPDATQYQVLIGSESGNRDYGARVTTSTQYRMRNLPTDGRQFFVTLRYRSADDQWLTGHTISVVAVNWPSLQIDSHQPGGVLQSDTAQFTWPANPDAAYYQIRAGSTERGLDLGAYNTTDTQFSMSNLPTDGRDVLVTILYSGSDGRWRWGSSVPLKAANLGTPTP